MKEQRKNFKFLMRWEFYSKNLLAFGIYQLTAKTFSLSAFGIYQLKPRFLIFI
jgi:hypothetical protein